MSQADIWALKTPATKQEQGIVYSTEQPDPGAERTRPAARSRQEKGIHRVPHEEDVHPPPQKTLPRKKGEKIKKMFPLLREKRRATA